MCYETTARPPFPPIAGGAATGESHTLASGDGTEFAAFSARSEKLGGPGIVVLPDVRGLHAFYEDLALRFAEAGIHSTAIDYFARTAGVGRRDDDFDFWPHVMKTTPDNVAADTSAAVAHLRAATEATSVFTVGFCFGGRASFDQATRGHGLSGVIGFYGHVGPRDENDKRAPIDHVSQHECPVLGLFGGEDQMITRESIEAYGAALGAAGVDNELHIYDGAPHSFFDRAQEHFKDASDDAWRRMLAFVEKYGR